jgi:hypothetical protein
MSIFYINDEKNPDDGTEFIDKYDFAKFIDGNSNLIEATDEKLKIVTK